MIVKVKIAFTVEVDVEVWANEYGCGHSKAAVREDVRRYFESVEGCPLAQNGIEVIR